MARLRAILHGGEVVPALVTFPVSLRSGDRLYQHLLSPGGPVCFFELSCGKARPSLVVTCIVLVYTSGFFGLLGSKMQVR